MKQFTISDRNYCAVEVAAGSTDFEIKIMFGVHYLFYHNPSPVYHTIPFGQWNLIGLASEINEEGWKGIVERAGPMGRVPRYKDYEYSGSAFYLAKESGYSLIESLSLNPDTTVLLEKIK